MTDRPLILLANDDGFRAAGLQVLRASLARVGEVIVCAPTAEQSAKSHSLTMHKPLRLLKHEPGVFSVDGTPADSVYVALNAGTRVLPRRPDLVVSGLNHGVNLGDDVFYSGTVAAAREAALKGVPAMAVSADHRTSMPHASEVCARLAAELIAQQLQGGALINVNFPAGNQWDVRETRLGSRTYLESIDFRTDPRGREYLWVGGRGVEHRLVAGSDTEAFDAGIVSVTPLMLDLWRSEHSGLAQSLASAGRR